MLVLYAAATALVASSSRVVSGAVAPAVSWRQPAVVPAPRLGQLTLNSDTAVVDALTKLFKAFDTNNDGFVNAREFCLAMSACVPSATPATKLDFIFRMYETDGNGTLDRDDCKALVRDMMESLGSGKGTVKQERVVEIVDQLFEHVDLDRNNSIDQQEFQQLVTNPALAGIRDEILNILKFNREYSVLAVCRAMLYLYP